MQFLRAFCRNIPALLLLVGVLPAARAVEPDKHVPPNTEALLVVNVQQIVSSPFVRTYGLEPVKELLHSHDQLHRFCKITGLDLLRDIHRITVGVFHAGKELNYVIVVNGNFNPETIQAALAEDAKTRPGEVSIDTSGGNTVYAIRLKESKEKQYFAAFADRNTLVVSDAASRTLAALKADSRVSPALGAALGKFGGTESMYAAIVVTDELKRSLGGNREMQNLVALIQHLTASFNLAADFQVKLALQTPDAKSADTMKSFITATKPFLDELIAGQAEKLGPGVGDVFKKIVIRTDDKNAVNIDLNVPASVIERMHDNAKGTEKHEKDKQ